MKASDLREKSVEDLRELQKTLAHDVFQNRIKNFTNRLDDTSSIRKNRRDLARVLTLLQERQGGGAAKPAKAEKAPKAEVKAKAAPAAEAAPKAAKKSAAKKSTAKKGEAK